MKFKKLKVYGLAREHAPLRPAFILFPTRRLSTLSLFLRRFLAISRLISVPAVVSPFFFRWSIPSLLPTPLDLVPPRLPFSLFNLNEINCGSSRGGRAKYHCLPRVSTILRGRREQKEDGREISPVRKRYYYAEVFSSMFVTEHFSSGIRHDKYATVT